MKAMPDKIYAVFDPQIEGNIGIWDDDGNSGQLYHHNRVVQELQTKLDKAIKALELLTNLNNDFSPFGGEIYRDKIDNAWYFANKTLEELK